MNNWSPADWVSWVVVWLGCTILPSSTRKTERQKDRKTERQKDRKTEKQKNRKTERQKERKEGGVVRGGYQNFLGCLA